MKNDILLCSIVFYIRIEIPQLAALELSGVISASNRNFCVFHPLSIYRKFNQSQVRSPRLEVSSQQGPHKLYGKWEYRPSSQNPRNPTLMAQNLKSLGNLKNRNSCGFSLRTVIRQFTSTFASSKHFLTLTM